MNKNISTQKGFTLIELLVVVAVIGILATVVLASLGAARTRAKDAAVTSAVSSFRNTIEIEFVGDYTNLCSSSVYTDFVTNIELESGSIEYCDASNQEYRIIARLPSGTIANGELVNIAYAQEGEGEEEGGGQGSSNNEENGFCINSSGKSQRVNIQQTSSFPSPACEASETPGGGAGYFYYCGDCRDSNNGGAVVPNSYCWNDTAPGPCY